jgi:hypothetical protein
MNGEFKPSVTVQRDCDCDLQTLKKSRGGVSSSPHFPLINVVQRASLCALGAENDISDLDAVVLMTFSASTHQLV